jgi:Flp pilus assembly protein CpaB
MTYRIRNIVVAVGLALLAMMLTLFYVTNYKRSVQKGQSSVQVYVASKDLTAGSSGADLVKSHAFRVETIARNDVVPGAISSPDQVASLVLSAPVYAGEQVTLRRFSDVAAQGIRAQLKGTMRAVQVPGDGNQLLAGTLRAGDRVDLVGNFRFRAHDASEDFDVSRIVLRDLLVLQAPSVPATSKVAPNETLSVILAVSDTQVQKLFYTLKNGDWSLQLRPVVDAGDSTEHVEDFFTILHDGLSTAGWNEFLRNLQGRP